MKKKGLFIIDTSLNWIYILIVLVIIILGYLIVTGKLAGYVDTINDFFRMRR